MFNEKEVHESYGMAGFFRCRHSGPISLYGTSIKHNDTIVLHIGTSYTKRDLNRQWYFKDKEMLEVEMSQSQFAELITSMGMGEGVPVTIRYYNGEYKEECPFKDISEEHLNDYKDHMKTQNALALELINNVKEIFETKKSFNKGEKEELLRTLTQLYNEVKPNEEYQLSSFQEQMDITKKEAKAEIEAFCENKLRSIAQAALVENEDVKKLAEDVHSPVEI